MQTAKPEWQEGLYPKDIIKEVCPCGHGIEHPAVGLERMYGFWMNLAQFIGVTPIPRELIWYCRKCGKEFASTKDRDLCHYFSY